MTPVTLPSEFNYVVPRERWDLFSLEDVYDFLCDRLPSRKIVGLQLGPLDVLSITTIQLPKMETKAKVKRNEQSGDFEISEETFLEEKKDHLLILECVDCTTREFQQLASDLKRFLPEQGYNYVLINKRIETLDRQELVDLLQSLTATLSAVNVKKISISAGPRLEEDRESLEEILQNAKRVGDVELAKEIRKILEGRRLDGKEKSK